MEKIKRYKRKKVSRFSRWIKGLHIKIYIVIIVICMFISVGVNNMVKTGSEAVDKADDLMSITEKLTDEESEEIKNIILDETINTNNIDEQQKKDLEKEVDNIDEDKLEKLKQKYKEKLTKEEIEKLKQMYDR